ncbi:MAG: dihydroneopterin aldolase, partial [Alicyclobacillus sp.]|nr:dihydroneopterin aldolase [Alicyclobacillus sp.]
MDEIHLSGMVFYGRHGALPEERALGQRFVIDVVLWLDLAPAGRSDRLADTVNYARTYETVRQVLEGPAKHLLESVAEAVAQRLLAEEPKLSGVRVAVTKPGVPIPGALNGVRVQIERWRQTAPD